MTAPPWTGRTRPTGRIMPRCRMRIAPSPNCRALDFMGIRHTEIAEGETDDAIAAYARTLPQGWELVISSFDSDFFQLISDRISVLRYRGDRTVLWDPARLREKYGIDPGQYVDFKETLI